MVSNPRLELSNLVNLGIFMNVDPKKHLHPISLSTKKIPKLTQTRAIHIYVEKVGEFYYYRYQAIIFLVKPTDSHNPRLPNTQTVRRYMFGPQKPTYQKPNPLSSYDSYDWKTRVRSWEPKVPPAMPTPQEISPQYGLTKGNQWLIVP